MSQLKVTARYFDENHKGCYAKGPYVVVVGLSGGFQRFRFDSAEKADEFARGIDSQSRP